MIRTLAGHPGCSHGCRPFLVGTRGDASGRRPAGGSRALTEFTPFAVGVAAAGGFQNGSEDGTASGAGYATKTDAG